MSKAVLYPSIVAFFNELSKPEYDPIRNRDREAETELIVNYQDRNDAESLQTLIKRNLRYIASIARRYMDGNDHDIDIFHAGVLGLITAINKYDGDRKCRLITYARDWIKFEIRKYKRNMAPVRLTHYMCWHLKKINIVIDDLKKAGQSCTSEDVSFVTGLPEKRVDVMQKTRQSQYITDSYPDLAGGEPEPFESLIKDEDSKRLHAAIDMLRDDEAFVIKRLYFDDDCTRESYRSVAKKLGCSHEQVRKLKLNAFDKIALAFSSN